MRGAIEDREENVIWQKHKLDTDVFKRKCAVRLQKQMRCQKPCCQSKLFYNQILGTESETLEFKYF